jgi:hypothetical protein
MVTRARGKVSRSVILAAVLSLGIPSTAEADSLNLFDWTAIAPEIVVIRVLGGEGKLMRVRVERTLRGSIEEGSEILVDERHANKTRLDTQPTLKLAREDGPVVLLLERSTRKNAKNKPVYLLVRGVDGARALPLEGAEAMVDALEALLRIQAIDDYDLQWQQFALLLESTNNPVVIETILDSYEKFRRGDAELLLIVEILLDHPRPPIRAKAAKVIGIVARRLAVEDAEALRELQPELMALARRDPSVEVRVAATEALGLMDPALTDGVLEEIADEDPEQLVRYTARKILLARQEVEEGEGGD